MAAADPPNTAAAAAIVRSRLDDPDPRVRAQAAWTLGTVGVTADTARLAAMARGEDPDGAADATAAIARIFSRERAPGPASPALCPLLSSALPLVRANALAGLALAGARCGDGAPERRALADDPAEAVRVSAALAVATQPSPEDVRALGRCARVDVSATVAKQCRESPPKPARTHATLVYVVPGGAELPRPGAPYALWLADGLVRTGTADRRGAVFDPVAPEGQMRLLGPDGTR
jgi:hypothetical protein